MRYAIIFAVVASAIVGGCGSFNSEQFQCPATEEGATCMSARQIYGATHVADRVAPNYRDGKPITDKQATHAIGSGDAELQPADANPKIQQRALVASPQQSDSYRPPVPDVDTPLPVRSPPQILRIRIFPWEDNARDLNAGTVVFTEVEGRTWTLGEEQVARVQASVTNPLAAPPRSSTTTTTQGSTSKLLVPLSSGAQSPRPPSPPASAAPRTR